MTYSIKHKKRVRDLECIHRHSRKFCAIFLPDKILEKLKSWNDRNLDQIETDKKVISKNVCKLYVHKKSTYKFYFVSAWFSVSG